MNKLTYRSNCFSADDLLNRIYNKTLTVRDDDLEAFVSELLEAFYCREKVFAQAEDTYEW